MVTRVHACLETAALSHGTRFIQVGGEKFVMLVDASYSETRRFAEALRCRVAALQIPLSHAEFRTPGMVAVSIGVTPIDAGPARKERLETAVEIAKRMGRNRVSGDA